MGALPIHGRNLYGVYASGPTLSCRPRAQALNICTIRHFCVSIRARILVGLTPRRELLERSAPLFCGLAYLRMPPL